MQINFKNQIKTKIIPLLAITNPVIKPEEGNVVNIEDGGNPLGGFIARLWYTMIIIGGLLVIVYFIWGAIDWLTGGGNEEKLKKARSKFTNAFMGLVLLVASFGIVKFMEFVFGFNITAPLWPVAGE